jgi:hypothetical protein
MVVLERWWPTTPKTSSGCGGNGGMRKNRTSDAKSQLFSKQCLSLTGSHSIWPTNIWPENIGGVTWNRPKHVAVPTDFQSVLPPWQLSTPYLADSEGLEPPAVKPQPFSRRRPALLDALSMLETLCVLVDSGRTRTDIPRVQTECPPVGRQTHDAAFLYGAGCWRTGRRCRNRTCPLSGFQNRRLPLSPISCASRNLEPGQLDRSSTVGCASPNV